MDIVYILNKKNNVWQVKEILIVQPILYIQFDWQKSQEWISNELFNIYTVKDFL